MKGATEPKGQTVDTYPMAFLADVDRHEPHHIRQEWLPWDEIVTRLTRHDRRPDKRGPCFLPVFLAPGTRVEDENVKQVGLLIFDFEHGPLPSDFLAAWDEYAFVIYSSHHCTEADIRWRAVFPLSRLMDGENWEAFYRRAQTHLAQDRADPVNCNPSRLWFLPSAPRDAPVFARYHKGRLLDPAEIPEPPPAPAPPPRPRVAGPRPEGTGDYRTLDIVRWFSDHGHYGRQIEPGKHAVLCPWESDHTEQRGAEDSDTVIWEAEPGKRPVFYCAHAHCADRTLSTVMDLWGDADRYCEREWEPPAYEVMPKPEDAPRPEERPDLREIAEQEEPPPREEPSFADTEGGCGTGAETAGRAHNAEETRQETPPRPRTRTQAAPPETQTLRTLWEKEFEPLRWIVDALLPEGFTTLIGPPKSYKSWLAEALSLSVIQGGLALGRYTCDPAEVLYLALEDSERRLQDRFKKLLRDERPPDVEADRLHYRTAWPRFGTEAGGLRALEDWLTAHEACRLVVIDILAGIRPPRNQNGDVYMDDIAFTSSLAAVAAAHRIAILGIHHTNKRGTEDAFLMTSGSQGMTGGPDGQMTVRLKRGELTGRLEMQHRELIHHLSEPMAFDVASGTWRILDGPDGPTRSDLQQSILDCLRECGPLTPSKVAAQIQRNVGTVQKTMQRMAEHGLLGNGGGVYFVPS